MKRRYQGSMTIEASYLLPLVLLVFSVTITLLFYYHDKILLMGTAHETAAYGADTKEAEEDELRRYAKARVNGKLLLFATIEPEITIEKEQVQVVCTARKKKVSVQVKCTVSRTEPEDYIRSIRKLKKLGEGKEEK